MYEALSGYSTALADAFRQSLESGSPLAFVFALAGGAIAALTPCVLPMIPVTVATIGAQADGDKRKAAALSGMFAMGIGLNCALVGGISAAVGRSAVDVARSPWATAIAGAVCLVLALLMFDAIAMPAPAFLQRFQSKQRMRPGYGGALISGLVFGVLAYACLAPIMAQIAVLVFRVGRIAYGTALMGVFGLGIGLPFVILGTFTGAITGLIRRGGWMGRVKQFFGWAMLLVGGALIFQAGGQHARAQLAQAADPPTPTLQGAARQTTSNPLAGMPAISLAAEGTGDPAEVGQEAPLFTWTDRATGAEVSLADLRDKPVWLAFFAEWCHNCAEEVPLLNQLRADHGDELYVIGIDYGDDRAVVEAWAAEHGVEYDILLDRDEEVLTDGYGQIGVPYNVVIDTDGIIRFSSTGLPKDVEGTLAEVLE